MGEGYTEQISLFRINQGETIHVENELVVVHVDHELVPDEHKHKQ
jgi:hypothetical protein